MGLSKSFGVLVVVLTFGILKDTEGAPETCCPDAWIPYQGSCYLFHDEEKIDWTEAISDREIIVEKDKLLNTYCNQKQSDLVAIETENESKFLKYYARKLFKTQSDERNATAFWLGATDGDIEGIWKWQSKDEELTYTEWDVTRNQPNSAPDNHEDCLALNGLYDFSWHDGLCKERIGYPLCEKQGTGSNSGNGMQIIG